MNFRNLVQKFNKVMLPSRAVAGLQVTNSDLRFLELKLDKGKLFVSRSASLRLPPGIVESGRVKDRINFIAALKTIHNQIILNGKNNINVVLTIPTGDVYAQAFNMPSVSKAGLEEAIELNLQIISPTPIEKAYYSWKVAREKGDGGQMELLGVFVQREIIDEFNNCLEEAGFGVAAIEFSSLSMARLLAYYKIIDGESSYLLVKITQEGLIFMILRNGNLYFDYFHSWDKVAAEGRGVSTAAINEIIYSESQRVLNFYSSHWGGQIKNIILITPALIKEISEFLKSIYPSMEIYPLSSDTDNLHGVRGAALRGLLGNPLDPDINLMNPQGINAYYRDQIVFFTRFWRNIAVTVMIFLVFAFIGADLFLRNQASALETIRETLGGIPDTTDLKALENKARAFNDMVASVEQYEAGHYSPITYLNDINTALDASITVSRLYIQESDGVGSIEGISQDQNAVISFKNRLAEIQGLQEVNLPLSNINPQPNGQVYFSMTFKVTPR